MYLTLKYFPHRKARQCSPVHLVCRELVRLGNLTQSRLLLSSLISSHPLIITLLLEGGPGAP